MLEFNSRECASIKLFAVKKLHNAKVGSRFMYRKLLLFAKLRFKSSIYELIEIF